MNPAPGGSAFTTQAAAERHRDRGHGVFLSESEFRFFSGPEAVQNHRLQKDRRTVQEWWRDAARERGGEEILFVLRRRVTPVPGSEPWAGKLGMAGLAFEPAVR